MPSTVTIRSKEGLTQEWTARHHVLAADEPVDQGGADSGPTPYELLLAALGTCTSMTLEIYARQKGWPLEGVEVTLHHDRVHAKDCEDCETVGGMINEIRREIRLIGPLDDAQRERLLQIAAKCPVHKTLTAEIKIRDTLAS